MLKIEVMLKHETPSSNEGRIFYLISNKSESRKIYTNLSVFNRDWLLGVNNVRLKGMRKQYMIFINECIQRDIKSFYHISSNLTDSNLDISYTAFVTILDKMNLSIFMRSIIVKFFFQERNRCFESYISALRSFLRFRKDQDILLGNLDSDVLLDYQRYLCKSGLTKNSSSFYMRILRAVYNRAVNNEFIINKYPFKFVYTGIDKTLKRALPLEQIRRIKDLDLSMEPSLQFARDMFMFSFYTRGMSFIDMAYLKKSDIINDVLVYKRRKTSQKLYIRWENCMQKVMKKYTIKKSVYVFPIIKSADEDDRMQYKRMFSYINCKLKIIGRMIKLEHPLTMYVARHSWASIAMSKKVPLSVISQGMGHDSEMTTRIYLSALETNLVDNANRVILNSL